MRPRAGFTLLELIIVVSIGMMVLGVAQVNVTRVLNAQRMQGAATTVAADLQLAQSLAERQRRAVYVSIDTVRRIVRVRDLATPTVVYSERHLGARGDHFVSRMVVSDTALVVYPNGLAAGPLSVRLFAATRSRSVTMTRAGQIRVTGS